MYRLTLAAFLFSTFTTICAQAEYRVYQYYVKSKNPFVQDSKAYLRTDTLDPESYVRYHGGHDSIEVELIRSWVCKGYTGNFKKTCPAPEEETDEARAAEQP